MKPITSHIDCHFVPDDFKNVLEAERSKLIYKKSFKFKNIIDYRNLIVRIVFEDVSNIPDGFHIFCFKQKTQIEKERTVNNTPAGSFGIYIVRPLLPNEKFKSNVLNINISSYFDTEEDPYHIERIGFDFDTIDITFKCQFFSKE